MSAEPFLSSRPWQVWTWFERSTVGLPLALLAFDIVGTNGAAHNWHGETPAAGVCPLDWLAWVLVAAGPVMLHFRRRFPCQVLGLVLVPTLAYLALGYTQGPIYLNMIAAVIGTAGAGYRKAAWTGATLFAVGMLLIPQNRGEVVVRLLGSTAWLLAVTLIPELVRVLRQRAEEAVRISEEEALRRAGEERLAIARELHDVLAHSISLIAVQANVALEVMDRKPEQARIALVAIKQASREALGEVRSVLSLMRGTAETAPRNPAPGLLRLGDLVQQTESAGLRTRLTVDGEIGGLPVAVDQAAYRIVQESLTNAVRHAGAGRVTVHVERGEGELKVVVADDGRGFGTEHTAGVGHGVIGHGPEDGTGNGIAGMRERAAALGGRLTTGPAPGGGFRVEARLPLARVSS